VLLTRKLNKMRNDNDDDYAVYEDTEEVSAPAASSAAPSDEQIRAFVEANIGNPALIAETAAQYGVSVADLSRATGYDSNVVVSYFQQADVAPPSVGGLNATKVTEPTPPPPPVVEIATPPSDPEEPIYEPPRPPTGVATVAPTTNTEASTSNAYLNANPDVAAAYKENSYGMTPQEFADYHYTNYGSRPEEGRSAVGTSSATNTTAKTTQATVADTTTDTKNNATTDTTKTTDTTDTTKANTTLPTLTDYQGNQFDGAKVLTLAQQIASNAGSMSGGVFQTKNENIGFSVEEATNLLGRPPTASEQVLLDMSRQMLLAGVDDLSKLQVQDITSSGIGVHFDPETNKYYGLIPTGDGETSTSQELTADQVAKIKMNRIGEEGEGGTVYKTIDDLVTGKGLFANGKMVTQSDALNHPIEYIIGNTYAGKGGTKYQLNFDPTTGKSVVSASGFSTSDAGMIMPIIMIASNFLMPGVGSFLTSTFVEAGMSEVVSQVVSKAVINGVTSGIMAEASGGKFGDGFLKGAVTGAISAGVAPMISTALPSDLSPAMSSALTKAGTAAITAVATGQDVGKAIGTQLLNSATSTGLGVLSGEMGLSTADAKLLTSVLTPVTTQLILNGNVNDATLMNAVLLAGSTVLANTGSVDKTTNVTTSDGTSESTSEGGLNLLARDASNIVGTGLGAVSTATGLLNKATSLTNSTTKIDKTKANLVGALRTNTPTTKTAATKPAALNTLNAAKTKTSAVKPAALGALNTAKKTMTAQQMSQTKASKPAAQVNVANLIPVKKPAPPQKVDIKTLIPVKTAQLPAGLNTKKMG